MLQSIENHSQVADMQSRITPNSSQTSPDNRGVQNDL